MATLTETASFFRNSSTRILQILAAVVALIIVYRLGGALIGAAFPEGSVPATVAFGKLPPVDLTSGTKIPQSLTFNIDTVSGDIPSLEARAKVFSLERSRTTFGVLDEAGEKATRAGFSNSPAELTPTTVMYAGDQQSGRRLTVEIATGNFKLESEFLADPVVISSRPNSLAEATNVAGDFMRNFDIGGGNYPADKISTTLYKVDNNRLVKAISLSQANLVQVVFNRADLDKIPVLYISQEDPLVWALVSTRQLVAAEKVSKNILKHKFATYPLKGARSAFEQLKRGQGVLSGTPPADVLNVRDVKLVYVESRKLDPYLQPVYSFELEGGLFAYVPAVSDLWVDSSLQSGN